MDNNTERLVADRDALLTPHEPEPAEIVNAQADGNILLVCDHASNRVPEALENLGLPEIELARHIGWDIGAADVTRRLARALNAPAVLSGYSRLAIDCNRGLDHPGSIPAESDGTPVPGNAGLTGDERAARVAALFAPYQAAVAQQADRLEHAMGPDAAPVIVSVHSFTPIMDGFERPWEIGVLWNFDGRVAEPLIDRLRRRRDLTVGDNEPYSGRDGFGYTLDRHADDAGRANVLLEIRQDLIDTHHGAAQWAELLGACLGDVLADDALYRRDAAAHD